MTEAIAELVVRIADVYLTVSPSFGIVLVLVGVGRIDWVAREGAMPILRTGPATCRRCY